MNRRFYHVLMIFSFILALILAACGSTPQSTTSSTPGPSSPGTINGVTLPPDAAPPEEQVLYVQFRSTLTINTLEFFESVYERFNNNPVVGDLFSDPLIRVNKNYQLVPGAATSWKQEGTVWTFQLDPNLVWNDGTPVTAEDYVATFRYAADPKHAWDFAWFFSGVIKNWDEVNTGKLPLDQLGVRAPNAHTFQVETVAPASYLPTMLIYSNPFQKKALDKHGTGKYNINPATSISSGPFVLKEWVQGKSFVLEANPKYKGTNKPYIQKIIAKFNAGESLLPAYIKGQIDVVGDTDLTTEDVATITKDPELSKDIHTNYGNFKTYYLFFDLAQKPFNDLKVRQALSHVIDREMLINTIVTPLGGLPAYSYLMPGFPASNPNAYKDIQNYDPAKAKQLLAEAGYPEGKGFPKLTMWLRNEQPRTVSVAKAIAKTMKEHLGIEVEVANKERKDFAEALNAKPTKIQFGLISYGMDYLDPSNMLGVWLSGGRHNWNSAEFDAAVKQANAFNGPDAERFKLYQQAERMLISDVAGVFVYHVLSFDIYRPYLVGRELEPDDVGVAGIHSPGYNGFSILPSSLYISRDVSKYRKSK